MLLSPMSDDTTHSPLSSPDVPDYCEPILAWRFWRLGASLDHLKSFYDSVWTPYEMFTAKHEDSKNSLTYQRIMRWMAKSIGEPYPECDGPPCSSHKPGIAYGCGVYGLKSYSTFQEKMESEIAVYWGGGAISLQNMTRIFGSVWLWGRIVEHELGYRAQYAYPASFTYGYNCDAAKLAKVYGIPYNEDQSWKSVFQSAESSQNRYAAQFQYTMTQNIPPPYVSPSKYPRIVPWNNLQPPPRPSSFLCKNVALTWVEEDSPVSNVNPFARGVAEAERQQRKKL